MEPVIAFQKEMAALLETLKKQLRKLNKTKEHWEETRTYIQVHFSVDAKKGPRNSLLAFTDNKPKGFIYPALRSSSESSRWKRDSDTGGIWQVAQISGGGRETSAEGAEAGRGG